MEEKEKKNQLLRVQNNIDEKLREEKREQEELQLEEYRQTDKSQLEQDVENQNSLTKKERDQMWFDPEM